MKAWLGYNTPTTFFQNYTYKNVLQNMLLQFYALKAALIGVFERLFSRIRIKKISFEVSCVRYL